MTIDEAFGDSDAIDDRIERARRIVVVFGVDGITFADERLQQAIASGETLAEQGDGDRIGLVAVMQVADDRKQVTRISAFGQRARGTLGVEDRDRIDDRVERVASDRVAGVVLGVDEAEAVEGVVEQRTHDGVGSGGSGLLGELLLAQSLAQGGARSLALGRGDVMSVELQARHAVAIATRSVIEHAKENGRDEQRDGACESARVMGRELDRWDGLREEAEAALAVGLVLRPAERRAQPQRIAERGIDVVGVVAGFVVEQKRERWLAGCLHAVLEGGDDGGAVFFVAHVDAHGGAGVCIDDEFEVLVDHLTTCPCGGALKLVDVVPEPGEIERYVHGCPSTAPTTCRCRTSAQSSSSTQGRALVVEILRTRRASTVPAPWIPRPTVTPDTQHLRPTTDTPKRAHVTTSAPPKIPAGSLRASIRMRISVRRCDVVAEP